jgi:diacylglycerol kinase family enzyme
MTSPVCLIVNPVKVDDPAGLREAAGKRAADAGLGVPLWIETTEDDPGAGMVRQALAAGATLILVCGGDGTVAACAGALADAEVAEPGVADRVAMAVVASGTGNLLARNLELPLDTDAALDVAFAAGRRRVDVLAAGEHRFVVMAGLGFDAALIRDTDEKLKASIGWAAYLGGLVRALRRSPRARFTVTVDDQTPLRRQAIGVLVGNVGQVQGGIGVLPDAMPDDGLLDVILLTPHRLRDWPVLLWRLIRRRPDAGRQADVRAGRQVRITVDRPLPVEYDGDFDGEATELTVTVMARVLTLCGAVDD